MSANKNFKSESHQIEANDDLVRSVIVDQTDNLEKGWREMLQNIIDSDATEGRLEFDHTYTLGADNGSGVDLTEQKGLDLLTVMGESSKDADNHESIGEFGIGKGQVIAKGKSVWISGETALFFDIKNWGLEAKTVDFNDAAEFAAQYDEEWGNLIDHHFGHRHSYPGMAILVKHYHDEVPDKNSYKWNKYENNVKSRFQYLNSVRDTDLYVNGDKISNLDPMDIDSYGEPTHTEVYDTFKTGKVKIAVRHGSGSLTVYSGGIEVTDVDSRGLEGQIVTERNLRLNFARNEIKSGCPVWAGVENRLVEIRKEVFDQADESKDLDDEARSFVADQMFSHGEIDEHSDMEVFETASEDFVSWNQLVERDQVGTAKKGNPAADKLKEAYDEIVLSKYDGAVKKFIEAREDLEEAPDDFDAEDRAESLGLHVSHEKVSTSDLKPTQHKQLGIARYIVEMMNVDREVRFGESDVSKAWTDGLNEIVITDSATDSSSWIQWVPELWQTVVHEISHNVPSKEKPAHGSSYQRRFRQNIEKEGGIEALSKLMGEIQENTLTQVAERGHNAKL